MSEGTCALLAYSSALHFVLCGQITITTWFCRTLRGVARMSLGCCVTVEGILLKGACTSSVWASVSAGSCGAVMSDVKPYHVLLSILSGLIRAPPVLQIMTGGFSFLLLQKSEGHTSPTWRTAKWNVSGSSAYFLRWPVKLHFIVKHCALPNILALSLPREASQSIWWKLIDCKQVLIALSGPEFTGSQTLATWARSSNRNPVCRREILIVY